ncbi:hypothetical protein GCM10009780_20490 [Actinomadura alba]
MPSGHDLGLRQRAERARQRPGQPAPAAVGHLGGGQFEHRVVVTQDHAAEQGVLPYGRIVRRPRHHPREQRKPSRVVATDQVVDAFDDPVAAPDG